MGGTGGGTVVAPWLGGVGIQGLLPIRAGIQGVLPTSRGPQRVKGGLSQMLVEGDIGRCREMSGDIGRYREI